MLHIKIVILYPHPCRRLNKMSPASFRETCQWLKFPLNGLRVQSRVSPVVGLLPLASGPACLGMAFRPFLVKQLYRCDSVVISSFVRTGCTTRRWGWLLGRIGYSITYDYPYATPQLAEGIMVDLWRDFWIRETGTGQQVAQLHESYMMMMMMTMTMMMMMMMVTPLYPTLTTVSFIYPSTNQ